MMRKYILLILILFLLQILSCAENNKSIELNEKKLDKIILSGEKVTIYNIDLDQLLHQQNIYKKLHEFPFISDEANLDFRGHFPIEFYQLINYKIRAKELKDVDFWKLRIYPLSLDVIYVKPIWLDDFKYVSNNLFEDICYTYNLSKREQEILLWWLKNGGILWIESGIYATGFENLNRDGSINLLAIKDRIIKLTQNLHFLEYPVNTVTYIYHYKSLTAMQREKIIFDNLTINNNFFKQIHRLEIILRYPIETFFYIPGKNGVIQDKNGRNLLTIIPYFKGKIIFLFPFDYVDAYSDGELFRWKLLQFIYSGAKYPSKKVKKDSNIK